ncbi:hypothetical protein AAEO56_03755 [Flavobacterium sp. DGU11]|uniref:Lipoprotein n=1 Tax=Flavobacterium arundinis TaxID=3139143 RepID=A0ABU9HT79_9FLAO
MKKIVSLIAFLALLTACSTDDSKVVFTQEADLASEAKFRSGPPSYPACQLGTITCSVYGDASGGLENVVAVFVGDAAGGSLVYVYNVYLEIQLLSDCEDITTGYGNTTNYQTTTPLTNTAIQNAEIRVPASALPANQCYRWRLTYEGVSPINGKPRCITTTGWNVAPVI